MSEPLRSTPLNHLPGITDARLDLLTRLGLSSIHDLLYHFPRSYEDLRDLRMIRCLTPDVIQTVQGEVVDIQSRPLSNGFAVSVIITDDQFSSLEGVWFNQPRLTQRFHFGQRVSFSGKPKWYRDRWQMTSPRVQILDGTRDASPGVVPIYPLTEDLRPETLRRLIESALDQFSDQLVDRLPETLRLRHGWPGLAETLRAIHRPESPEQAQNARLRVIYEELLLVQIALGLRRRELRDRQNAPVLNATPLIDTRIRRLFPFALTADQDAVISAVCQDMNSTRPMQRLVQADVGAGKTAIAVYAMLVAVANRHQAALMAPTEVLARQHARTLDHYLANSRVRRLLLTGGMTTKERREAREALRRGEIDLVVGTQALIQQDVQFARLGLVVIDEQHKFGVHQRARVRQMGIDPHYLIMTATPIPRTIALTVFGDLDVSCVKQLPPGRQAVTTRWLREGDRERVYTQLREALSQGRQAYVVCPLVEESNTTGLRSVTEVYKDLRAGPLRDFRVGLLHGRMEEEVKAEVMNRFRTQQIDVLVCTSVIEVGVDVGNATWMIIEDAERFGLSQLHQLRGRVSRGKDPGFCFLFADPSGEEGRERLRVFVRTTDGFTLADEDARLRGAGELFGTRQSGSGELWWLAQTSMELLEKARTDAFALVAADPQLKDQAHHLLREAVAQRYGETLELSEIG